MVGRRSVAVVGDKQELLLTDRGSNICQLASPEVNAAHGADGGRSCSGDGEHCARSSPVLSPKARVQFQRLTTWFQTQWVYNKHDK